MTPTPSFSPSERRRHSRPKIAHHQVTSAVNWLVELVNNIGLSDVVKDTAELMLLALPGVLCPLPPLAAGVKQLRPHARVKDIQARRDLLRTGGGRNLSKCQRVFSRVAPSGSLCCGGSRFCDGDFDSSFAPLSSPSVFLILRSFNQPSALSGNLG